MNFDLNDKSSVKALFISINKIASNLTDILSKIELDPDISKVDHFYNVYFKYFIEDYQSLNKLFMIGSKRGSIAMHIFVELSRAHFIMNYRLLMSEKEMILKGEKKDDMLQLYSLKNCKSDFWYVDNDKNIFTYNQQELIDLILSLTKKIAEMPYNDNTLADFKQIVLILFTRNSVFFCQTCSDVSLNVDEMRRKYNDEYSINREYAMFCTIYFNQLFRRIYYYDQIATSIIKMEQPDTLMVEEWIKEDVCGTLGTEAIEDTYAQACDDSYTFPGDEEWFKYICPGESADKGPVLNYIREDQAKLYFSPNVISIEPILSATKGFRADHQGVSTRMFVLMALDQHFRCNYGIEWLNTILVKNNRIEYSRIKLRKHPFPCLVQILCGFWVYSKDYFYPTNNIYDTIHTWFYILQKDYNCNLLGIDLREQTNSLLNKISDIDTLFLL